MYTELNKTNGAKLQGKGVEMYQGNNHETVKYNRSEICKTPE